MLTILKVKSLSKPGGKGGHNFPGRVLRHYGGAKSL